MWKNYLPGKVGIDILSIFIAGLVCIVWMNINTCMKRNFLSARNVCYNETFLQFEFNHLLLFLYFMYFSISLVWLCILKVSFGVLTKLKCVKIRFETLIRSLDFQSVLADSLCLVPCATCFLKLRSLQLLFDFFLSIQKSSCLGSSLDIDLRHISSSVFYLRFFLF